MGLNLKILKNEPCIICMTLYTERNADQTDHFADVFVREKRCVRLWRNDVRKYIADAILFREIQCKKMDNLMF